VVKTDLPAIEGGRPVRDSSLSAWPKFTQREKELILQVLESGRLVSTLGRMTREFEEKFARFLGVKYAAAVFNGTVALHTALTALGVGPGDEVITTPFTFAASATTILHSNAIPVFADIDLETLNISPTSIEEKISDKTRAILVVHLAGHPAEMDEIMKIARENNLYVIEDCAQAIGSEYRGVKVGGIGDLGTFSFYQTKNMTTGEGGMVTTNSDELAEKVRLVRDHGQTSKYEYTFLGFNYRMTELQAALGIGQLERIEELNRRRAEIAKIYFDELQSLDGELLKLPRAKPYVKHTWHIYEVLLKLEKLKIDRDSFVKALKAENVLVTVAYPKPLHLTTIFKDKIARKHGCPWRCPFYGKEISYRRGDCPNAEYAAKRVITLPTLTGLTDEDAIDIAKAVKKVATYYKR